MSVKSCKCFFFILQCVKNIIFLDKKQTNNYVTTKTACLPPRSKINDEDKSFAFVFFPHFFAIVFGPANI